jgi:hypothetical protein
MYAKCVLYRWATSPFSSPSPCGFFYVLSSSVLTKFCVVSIGVIVFLLQIGKLVKEVASTFQKWIWNPHLHLNALDLPPYTIVHARAGSQVLREVHPRFGNHWNLCHKYQLISHACKCLVTHRYLVPISAVRVIPLSLALPGAMN